MTENLKRYDFHGIRQGVYSETGWLLYVSNDTVAKRIWNFIDNVSGKPRLRDQLLCRFPLRHIWDMLALGQLTVRPDLSLADAYKCWRFYFGDSSVRNLMATPGRTGSNWSMLTFDLAMHLKDGGDGDYDTIDGRWYPHGGTRYSKLDWRTPIGVFNQEMGDIIRNPLYFHTHQPYYRVRFAKLKSLKTIVHTRSILESLESHFFKHSVSPRYPEVTKDVQVSFPWDRHLDEVIEFYNSWGEAMKWMPNVMVARYHETKQDPVGTHKAMADFWGLDLPEDLIAEALKRTSKKAMAEKLGEEDLATSQRVSTRDERGVIEPELKEFIFTRIRRDLIHTFGYDYSDSHIWGQNYD